MFKKFFVILAAAVVIVIAGLMAAKKASENQKPIRPAEETASFTDALITEDISVSAPNVTPLHALPEQSVNQTGYGEAPSVGILHRAAAEEETADARVADLSAIDYDKICTWSFTYPSYDGSYSTEVSYDDFPLGAYEYFRTLPRYYSISDWEKYMSDEFNRGVCDDLAKSFLANTESTFDAVIDAVAFGQALEYIPDGDEEYPKYPVETLYDKGGDCEDTSLLICGIIRSMGIGSALILFDNHCAVGILGDESLDGAYFEVDGNRYYYVESTGDGWQIGEIPEEYQNKNARLFVVK